MYIIPKIRSFCENKYTCVTFIKTGGEIFPVPQFERGTPLGSGGGAPGGGVGEIFRLK